MEKTRSETLEEDLKYILEEARVVIPGVQTLLGFQLIAVFNQLFPKELSPAMQIWHLVSTALTSLAMILIMSPASYHRMAGHTVSRKLVDWSSRFLLAGMCTLAVAICIDVALVAAVILKDMGMAGALSSVLFALFIVQWLILPRITLGKGGKS
jgi:hypothetical protein